MIYSKGNPFVLLQPGSEVALTESDRLQRAGHLWSREEIDALILAWAARRPLLVRGEAGSGKSQIARAAAWILGEKVPLIEVIHPRFEALDLLYTVDLVERLADAQLQQVICTVPQGAGTVALVEGSAGKAAVEESWRPDIPLPHFDRTNRKYVKHGALWRALDIAREAETPPVLLIDEIDKADADVPNALLEVLGNRSFTVQPLQDQVVGAGAGRLPLVIVTTNEERELPPAFVRRCVVLNLNPPDDDATFLDWLIRRGRVHHHLKVAQAAQEHSAKQVLADRKEAYASGCSPVGLAEYIDLLTALDELTREVPDDAREQVQLNWIQRLSAYALVKHVNQNQSRRPLPLRVEAHAEADDQASPS